MGGPGSGRRKVTNGSNGSNGHTPPAAGPRVTFGDMFAKMAAAAPAPAVAPVPTPTPPTPGPAQPAPAPPERAGNRSFAELAGYVAVNVGVVVIGDGIRKGGREPREVPQEDLDRTIAATSDAIVRGLGDMEVPWWAGLATAWGNLYLAMRVGAKPLEAASSPPAEPATTTTTTATTSPAPALQPSPLGQAPPPQPRRPVVPRGGELPAIETMGSP